MGEFRKIAILGTGLMGGSLALALRQAGFPGVVAGWDQSEVLERAAARGVVDEASSDLGLVLGGAQLIVLATPIGLILRLLPEVFARAEPDALVTDLGSTKAAICRLAQKCARGEIRFLGGHPMVGRATSGIEAADAELYRGCTYLLVGEERAVAEDNRVREFVGWIELVGARPRWTDEETHDWAVAMVSHVPQLLSTALASVVSEELDDDDLPLGFAGPAFAEMTRLAESPFEIWREIARTNPQNIERALERLIQRLEWIKMHLGQGELEVEFRRARELRAHWRRLQPKPGA